MDVECDKETLEELLQLLKHEVRVVDVSHKVISTITQNVEREPLSSISSMPSFGKHSF